MFKHLHFYCIFVVGSEGTWSGRLAPEGLESTLPKYLETSKSKTQGRNVLLSCMGAQEPVFVTAEYKGWGKSLHHVQVTVTHKTLSGCEAAAVCRQWQAWCLTALRTSLWQKPVAVSTSISTFQGHQFLSLVDIHHLCPPFMSTTLLCRKSFKASTKPRTEAFSWPWFHYNENKNIFYPIKNFPSY